MEENTETPANSGRFVKVKEFARRTFPATHYAVLAALCAATFAFARYGDALGAYSIALEAGILVMLVLSFWLTSLVANDYAESLDGCYF